MASRPAPSASDDHRAFEELMRVNNGRLFRVARSILKDEAEAEDALQDAYLHAYRHLSDFRGGSQNRTWLTRIVINESLMRLRRKKRERVVEPIGEGRDRSSRAPLQLVDTRTESPSNTALRAEVRRLLEQRIDELPVAFRAVFVMRDVED